MLDQICLIKSYFLWAQIRKASDEDYNLLILVIYETNLP